MSVVQVSWTVAEVQRIRSWPAVLQYAIVEDAAIVHFTKPLFEDKIGDSGPLTLIILLLSK
jgi:hypothetical protein